MMRKLAWTILLVSAVAGMVFVATRDPEPWVILLVALVFFAALAELLRNQQVSGSIPLAGSIVSC